MSVLEQVRPTWPAMKAGDRDRATRCAGRPLAPEGGEGGQRRRGRRTAARAQARLEAAEAYRDAGREDLAAQRARGRADRGVPARELSDDELDALVGAAIAETGAPRQRDMGKVMGA